MSRRSRGHNKRTQSTRGAPEAASDVRHTVRGGPIGRDRTGARCSEPTAPRASWVAPSVVTVGGAAAAAAAGHTQAASEPRASRAEGSPHTGV